MGEVVRIHQKKTELRALVCPYTDGSGAEIEIEATVYEDGEVAFEMESIGKHDRRVLHELVTTLTALIFKIDEIAPTKEPTQ